MRLETPSSDILVRNRSGVELQAKYLFAEAKPELQANPFNPVQYT